MKVLINGQDYSGWLDGSHRLSVVRKLNEPSVCKAWLCLPAGGAVAAPVRGQAVCVQGDDGTLYFTGYLAAGAVPEYAGMGMEGPRYRLSIEAVSDEVLMDQSGMMPSKGTACMSAGALMAALVTHSGQSGLGTQGLTLNAPISWFAAEPGAPWSKSAGEVAAQARAAYRALAGTLSLTQIPVCVHALSEADGSLSLADLALAGPSRRLLANDVTVCGEEEPAAYVTELFAGDGSTKEFELGATPYGPQVSRSVLIHEEFDEPTVNLQVWTNSGTSYLKAGTDGLLMQGGSGRDGDALLAWIDPAEMGGTLLLEAQGVALNAGSAGIVAGLYSGLNTMAGCVAGFQVTAQAGTGAVQLQPVVLGVATGAVFNVQTAHQYTLRVRVHCAEQERMQAVYRTAGDGAPIAPGGAAVAAAGNVQFDVQEFVNGVAGMPVVLYDGAIASLPGACQVVAASSVTLNGSMRGIELTNIGSGWVVSTPVNGGSFTRRQGSVAQGGECHVSRAGKLTFYAGSVPAAGEQLTVSYRATKRAVGRAVNAASQQALAQAGLPAVAAWTGSVTNPAARSSADCRNAAQALAAAAGGVNALWRGTYKTTSVSLGADVWPGDALALSAPSAGLNTQVVVRAVTLSYAASVPDMVGYAIEFANDWVEDLGIKTSATVPESAWLPAPVAPSYLANLNGLTVTAVNGSTVTVNAGVAAPAGGGFEVRRRDYAFAPGQDADLVLRGTLGNLTWSRQSGNDRFYVRMYDGATPPNYSEFSAALFVNLPLGA